uniref:Uncharacterized protein n=1 Tax=Arundo donax TaxID=35708 RepID=A0A0A9CS51_ARUDO
MVEILRKKTSRWVLLLTTKLMARFRILCPNRPPYLYFWPSNLAVVPTTKEALLDHRKCAWTRGTRRTRHTRSALRESPSV